MSTIKKVSEPAGTLPITFTGNALYFTQDRGTFEGEGVKGTFCSTVGSAALVITIEGGGSYEVRAQDAVIAAVAHHKQRKNR